MSNQNRIYKGGRIDRDQAINFNDYEKTYKFLSSKTGEIISYTGDFGHTVTKEVSQKVSEWLSN